MRRGADAAFLPSPTLTQRLRARNAPRRTASRRPPCGSMRDALGPYRVGVHDALLPDAAGGNRVRFFYPTADAHERLAAPRWLPHSPGFADDTLVGALRYVQAPAPGALAILMGSLRSVRLESAYADAPVLDCAAGWPLVLFSHGLAGGISAYSLLCVDVASHGFVVMAPEHLDGSAMNAFAGRERTNVRYKRYREEEDGPEWEFRNKMLRTRVDEFGVCVDVLRRCARGDEDPLRPADPVVAPVDIAAHVDLSQVLTAGHSFGGATALSFALTTDIEVERVLCIDAWLFSLKEQDLFGPESHRRPHVKALFLDAELSNMTKSVALRKRITACDVDCVTALGAVHNNTSDFPVFIPKFLAYRIGMTQPDSDPLTLVSAQSRASGAFLAGVWDELKETLSADMAETSSGLSLRSL